jgi:hypothetical protein
MKWQVIQAKLHDVIKDPKSGFSTYTFNEALSILVRERFVARAAQSEIKNELILKGGSPRKR